MTILNQNIAKKQNCYMGTESFIIHIKTKYFYKDISDDVEKGFDTSNYIGVFLDTNGN